MILLSIHIHTPPCPPPTHTQKLHLTQLTTLTLKNTPQSPKSKAPSRRHPPRGCPSEGHPFATDLRSAIYSLLPSFVNAALLEHRSIHLWTIHGCFHATTAELSICNKDYTVHKAKTLIWPFASLPTSAVPRHEWSFMELCYEQPKERLQAAAIQDRSRAQMGYTQLRTPKTPPSNAYSHAQRPSPGLLEDSDCGRELRTR